MSSDILLIDGKKFQSRLIMGTALYPNLDLLNRSLESSGTEIITLAIRRLDIAKKSNFLDQIKKEYTFLPNTAGCFTKKEAILTAELARESLKTNWIKLELISDEEMLLPDPIELFEACKELIKKKFKIFAYCSDDPIFCKRLEDLGCEVVMPLISPIGSGLGIRNEHNLEIIRKICSGKIFIDAGIGKPSDAARIMEMGFDGVLLNSSVARSLDPENMAEAMKLAVISGRKGYRSGLIEKSKQSIKSTTFKGKISNF
ncbi:MAG: thiazole synthase [Pseudomonadota bacterium]|nr:thiazole synthase [Pseudomonadota bacterium]